MNEENNVMMSEVNNEEQETNYESSGISMGLAMLIGAGLALAGAKAVKTAKKVYARHKEKKLTDLKVVEVECVTDESENDSE